ncbi:methylated-DNA--[protein]-cysteine S-methyltransferase [Apilactobacillus micheneri]|nr:methylated-DNA--[protein]-cysteine S-methyltransferase [Apilactobacillus micheneri]TPR45617.1 methylated-DNA--[protein]-cysteine S-methyltransferase [Apilactobacillus micheneri]TPR49064.1 methylated-DNA--[protein]-cysteine S-methyltransferase [Apilactobacillus micheneri]
MYNIDRNEKAFMEQLLWDKIEYNNIQLIITANDSGISFVNNPNCGISEIYDFFPNLAAEFKYGNEQTEEYKIQIREYLDGNRKYFDLPMNLIGNEFQKKVWSEITTIKYGETIDLNDFANQFAESKSQVEAAILSNPLIILIPSHRITGVDYENSLRNNSAFIKYLLNIEKE